LPTVRVGYPLGLAIRPLVRAERGRSGKTHNVNVIQRLLFGAVGAGAVVLGVVRYRLAPRSAEAAARVGMVPRPFRSVTTYRFAAALTGVIGGTFILIAGFAK